MVQLSKYIWAVTSFGGVPSAEGFAKRYELHYQPRKMDVDGAEVYGQYGCINFHVKRRSQRAKLIVAVKNKWAGAWPLAWFYCKVPLIWSPSPGQGKGVYALHSYITELSIVSNPSFSCPNDDVSDGAFVKATRTIGGRDAMEEYVVCELFSLSANFGLGEIADEETPVLKVSAPMTDFPVARHPEETVDEFCARMELAIEDVVRRYTRGEHKACIKILPNHGRVNRVFEHVDVPYGPRLDLSSKASERPPRKENKMSVPDF
jgi:hypothetical protein